MRLLWGADRHRGTTLLVKIRYVVARYYLARDCTVANALNMRDAKVFSFSHVQIQQQP